MDDLYSALELKNASIVRRTLLKFPDTDSHSGNLSSENLSKPPKELVEECVSLLLNSTKWYSEADTELVNDHQGWSKLNAYIWRVFKYRNVFQVTFHSLLGFLEDDKQTAVKVKQILLEHDKYMDYVGKNGKKLGIPELDLNNLRMTYVLYAEKDKQKEILKHLIKKSSIEPKFRNGQNDNLLIMSIKKAMKFDIDVLGIAKVLLNTRMSLNCKDSDGISTFDWVRQSRIPELISIIDKRRRLEAHPLFLAMVNLYDLRDFLHH